MEKEKLMKHEQLFGEIRIVGENSKGFNFDTA